MLTYSDSVPDGTQFCPHTVACLVKTNTAHLHKDLTCTVEHGSGGLVFEPQHPAAFECTPTYSRVFSRAKREAVCLTGKARPKAGHAIGQ